MAWVRTDMQGFPEVGAPPLIHTTQETCATYPGLTRTRMGGYRVPFSSDFTSFGTNIVSIEDRVARLLVTLQNSSGELRGLTRPFVSSGPYTIECCVQVCALPQTTDSAIGGIVLSDGTKYIAHYAGMTAQQHRVIAGNRWSNKNSGVSVLTNQGGTIDLTAVWTRITDDGTTRTYWISVNGKDWVEVANEGTNSYLTPTEIGMAFYGNSNSQSNTFSVLHWDFYSGILPSSRP